LYRNTRTAVRCLLALAPILAPAALAEDRRSGPTPESRGPIYYSVAPLNETVAQRILPQLEHLTDRLLAQRKDMRLDGVEVFKSDDRFLPGKIAIGMAHVLLRTPRNSARFETLLAGYRTIAALTVDDVNEGWGIYYYVLALHRLDQAGLLDRAVDPQTLRRLSTQLDWRSFVRESDLSLIDLPNNYFGVAFGIASLRAMLGWESAAASEALLARTMRNYRAYSGEYGFGDETDGEGRFDRYSVLLIGEIAHRVIEAGITPPAELKQWLRQSVDVLLPRLNLRGEGFEYGRSIGSYGETAFIEVFAAAATLGVLSEKERDMAHAFTSRIAARYMDFWQSPRTRSVNLWDEGRRTDSYRGKHRILGENLSLAHQYIYVNDLWNRLGFANRAPDADFGRWLDTLPASSTTWFARGEYDRLLITTRDNGRVIGLPLINGGKHQHMNTPYFPVPFSPGMLQGSPDAAYPHLLPRFTLADRAVLMPLAYFKNVRVERDGERTTVTYVQDEMDRLGSATPVKDARLRLTTSYELAPGRITRTDRYVPAASLRVERIELEFGTFSGEALADGKRIRFGAGEVFEFEASGLDQCSVDARPGELYRTPVGALHSRVVCNSQEMQLNDPLVISWTLKYR
jgi:hypothetical protein